MVLPEYTHTPRHIHTYVCTQKHHVSVMLSLCIFPSSDYNELPTFTSFVHEIWGEWIPRHIRSDNPLHPAPLNRWDESMYLLDTNCPLFNQPFGNQLQEEYGQVGRKVLHSLIHPSPSLTSGKGACYNTSFPPLSRLVERWEVTSSCYHCHQKSCSIWQTETDGLLLREACFVDMVQPEGPKHHFSVVIGNMIWEGSTMACQLDLHRSIKVKQDIKCILFSTRFPFCPTWSTCHRLMASYYPSF